MSNIAKNRKKIIYIFSELFDIFLMNMSIWISIEYIYLLNIYIYIYISQVH